MIYIGDLKEVKNPCPECTQYREWFGDEEKSCIRPGGCSAQKRYEGQQSIVSALKEIPEERFNEIIGRWMCTQVPLAGETLGSFQITCKTKPYDFLIQSLNEAKKE